MALHQKNVICWEASPFSARAVARCSGDCKLGAEATKTCFQNALVGLPVWQDVALHQKNAFYRQIWNEKSWKTFTLEIGKCWLSASSSRMLKTPCFPNSALFWTLINWRKKSKLDQVKCALLIQWVVKREKDPVSQTVRYAMMNYKVVLAGTYWYWASESWYNNSIK